MNDHDQVETYREREVKGDELLYWNQLLAKHANFSDYTDWKRGPVDIEKQARSLVECRTSYYPAFVRWNAHTGNDPALFALKNGKTYLIARWRTDEMPLRSEEQLRLEFVRRGKAGGYRNRLIATRIMLVLGAVGISGVLAHFLDLESACYTTAFLLLMAGIFSLPRPGQPHTGRLLTACCRAALRYAEGDRAEETVPWALAFVRKVVGGAINSLEWWSGANWEHAYSTYDRAFNYEHWRHAYTGEIRSETRKMHW